MVLLPQAFVLLRMREQLVHALPDRGYGSGMNSAATPLLIGVEVSPSSSERNAPAAEIAM